MKKRKPAQKKGGSKNKTISNTTREMGGGGPMGKVVSTGNLSQVQQEDDCFEKERPEFGIEGKNKRQGN